MSDMNALVFAEYYRPKTIDECILPENTKKMIKDAVASGNIPHFVFAGSAGIGKTSLARAICNEINADLLYINASLETSIDVIRTKVVGFSSAVSFDGNMKVILMDECLHEDEKVRIGSVDSWEAIALKDLKRDTTYPIVSFNMETGEYENDSGNIISDREDELFEVTLSSGEKILANSKHPFICLVDGKFVERTIEQGLVGFDVVRAV